LTCDQPPSKFTSSKPRETHTDNANYSTTQILTNHQHKPENDINPKIIDAEADVILNENEKMGEENRQSFDTTDNNQSPIK
jgi:hypothetical protein